MHNLALKDFSGFTDTHKKSTQLNIGGEYTHTRQAGDRNLYKRLMHVEEEELLTSSQGDQMIEESLLVT